MPKTLLAVTVLLKMVSNLSLCSKLTLIGFFQAEIAALKAQMEKAESKVYQYQRQSIKELILNQKLIDRHELVLTAIRDRHGWFYEEHGECPC